MVLHEPVLKMSLSKMNVVIKYFILIVISKFEIRLIKNRIIFNMLK